MISVPIKTGICSYGMSGKLFHAPFIHAHPGYELTAIVERNRNESRERYPDSELCRSFEELISMKDLQLIVVNTPVQTHFDYAKRSIEAGKSVIVEKPFTVTSTEAAILDQLALERKAFLSVYQNRRYDGDYRAIKKVVEDDLLGELKEVEMRFDRYRPGYSGKEHKEGRLPGAGSLHDLGAHLIDQALQLFGWPQKIFADIRQLRKDVEANDYFELLLYYPSLTVRIKSTIFARETYYAYILHGEKGTYLQQRSDMQEQQLLAGVAPSISAWCPPPASADGLLHTEKNGVVTREATTSTPGNYMGYYDDVYKSLAGAGPNPVPAGDAVKIMMLIEAAFNSADTGKIVELNS
jgi:scyllo-inositol 2-dehydrogenase (NADP+)